MARVRLEGEVKRGEREGKEGGKRWNIIREERKQGERENEG